MPELSRFYGIIIYMYWEDHAPPHFHACYGTEEALILIENGAVHRGSLPARALKLVREWMNIHQEEIAQQWEKAVQSAPIQKIAPLK